MASAADLRSGGKILRARRTAVPRTPYDRPSNLLPNSSPQNPNWLSKLILSPTRMIATGAGKLLSALRSDSPSSSSSSSSDGDSSSEGDSDDVHDDNGVSSQDANQLVKFDSLGKDIHAIEWKSETKRAIERLLMQETFSREECERLTYIIKSRVVDPPVTGGVDGRLSDIRIRAFGSDVDMPDLSAAVTEAKKWLEEKKLGSNSKPQMEYGSCSLNTAVSPHGIEGEIGSPVDLAKSYMRERPPWASSSMNHVQLKSPPLVGTQLFKDDTPYLYSGNSVSTSKLITDFPSIGSWNITDEIRKVRSKATEDMLRRRPLSITDFSTLASDYRRSPRSLVADKAESVPQIQKDRLKNQASPPDPVASVSQQSQDLIAIRITEEVEALPDSSEGGLSPRERLQPSDDMKAESQNGNTAAADRPLDAGGSGQPLNSTVGGDNQDSRSHEVNFSTLVEVTVVDGAVASNGFPSPGSSLHAGHEGEEKSKLSSVHNKLVDSGHNNKNATPLVGDTREILIESDIQFPIANDNNNDDNNVEAIVSQTSSSSSMQHEEILHEEEEILPPNSKRKAGKNNYNNNVDTATVAEKQKQGTKRRYVRNGKGRLK